MTDGVYCYPPDFTILRNKLDIRDANRLDKFERRSVTQRITEGVPSGNFDLAHLRAIHKHLFQDADDWADELPTLEISKGGHQFQFRGILNPARRMSTALGGTGLSTLFVRRRVRGPCRHDPL